ncbi:MAG: phosphoserine phosphatase SerB [Methylotenera sp. 24-45-7]|jgi:phosphoserine phosphatase|nr:MAG: phosphoserine phosphatase SerB [Methylotenera sp. 24-45-7]OZA09020.1 MAG: phosphoserine phosphatase SerB [Methylotenera sp. 17-45-7]OZA51147.1 MAG: phosphoserine phosphatase SerB [Methylophilales bacterium 39-45-7]HQS37637.1 phosphoserine phosphatase SerB [Methylotenera sp.]HQS43488.1 phosphoserine phosphatase SerB [Methylotenera sp.]
MRLVVQGSAITFAHLAHIHQLCATSVQFVQIAQHGYYLSNQATVNSDVQKFCAEQNIDCAYVQDKQLLKSFGLCVMDMDSTLISIECIDEIADMVGIKPQVAAITERAMLGELDFAQSLRERVALLKGLSEQDLMRVLNERLKLNPGAKEWIATCKQHNIKTLLVSGGFTFFAERVKEMLGLDYAVSNTLEIIDGTLTGKVLGDIVDAQRKADELTQLRDQLGLTTMQTIAIGDGANDLKMMVAAGVGVAYHAKPVVQAQATFALNHVGLDGVINLFNT